MPTSLPSAFDRNRWPPYLLAVAGWIGYRGYRTFVGAATVATVVALPGLWPVIASIAVVRVILGVALMLDAGWLLRMSAFARLVGLVGLFGTLVFDLVAVLVGSLAAVALLAVDGVAFLLLFSNGDDFGTDVERRRERLESVD